MTSFATTKLGHHSLDFPAIFLPLSHPNNSNAKPIPVSFLFKSSATRHEEILKQLEQGDSTPWDEGTSKAVLGIVPWLRSFTPSIDDIRQVAVGTCITLDESLLTQGKCILSHHLPITDLPYNNDTREFAIVEITEAYKLACATTQQTWFPNTLPYDLEFTPLRTTAPEPDLTKPEDFDGRLPVFVTVPLTPQQETYLSTLLTRDLLSPAIFHVPNPNPNVSDMHHLTQHFLAQHWIPSDFAIIDAVTVSTIPDPIPNLYDLPRPPPLIADPENRTNTIAFWGQDGGAFPPPHASLALATELQMTYFASDGYPLASDKVGYAVGRMPVLSDEVYESWCNDVSRRAGLGPYIGVLFGVGEAGDGEGVERWYWGCWVGEGGEVDGEVRAGGTVQF